jgi:hypothetical protein
MGFVPSSSTIQLYAYFTEYARERIFNGDVPDFKVTQFTLHDEDINYIISKETIGVDSSGNTIYNIPKSGFLPDITGDIDSCIKSNKNGIVFGRNMLTGTTQVSTPVVFGCTNPAASNYNPSATVDDGSCIITQSRILTIGFEDTNVLVDNSIDLELFYTNFATNIVLKQPVGDPNPPTADEIANTRIGFQINYGLVPLSDYIREIGGTFFNVNNNTQFTSNKIPVNVTIGRRTPFPSDIDIFPFPPSPGTTYNRTPKIGFSLFIPQNVTNRVIENGKKDLIYNIKLRWVA